MIKKLLKRYMPDNEKLKANKSLKIFGDNIHHPSLWYFNRRSVCKAVAIGLFCAFIPLPFQMLIAACLALFLRANLPLAAAAVWVSNPITIPPMFYGAYRLGVWILGKPGGKFDGIELSVHWVETQLALIWKPLLLGAFICGVVFSILGYLTVNMLWRWQIAKRIKARQKTPPAN